MITIDQANMQIISTSCLNCQDVYFKPPSGEIPKVGCCSYSPTFYLLQLANMSKKEHSFDIKSILQHQAARVEDYKVTVFAHVHEAYFKVSKKFLTQMEKDDLRHSYSICQFFKEKKGCILDPSFKNSVCRSFICTNIEESLHYDQQVVQAFINEIRTEEHGFQKYHEQVLKQKGINLREHSEEVIEYLKTI
ncbi:hypothetical protein [Halalkalibacter nanhaiisediminis]|uniref:Uncharacterized protein n=1 Tax=Halalkalibacter nanhaiisediminis TaxID=688079 RepID=A0A562QR92_9BACI|nr:hypothetical protein [Halalkalibacter nanhaiisediminis]TWI59215.1 hypothetical protein IQ10_00928 [Halalkalibacter nanhaiisediminis]